MKLSDLTASIEIDNAFHMKELDITGIAYHSGKVKQGYLFVCIQGLQTDGHAYLANAIDHGAVAAIVEKYQDNFDIPQIVVSNSRSALARLAQVYYGYPSQKLQMIGITATNGKTTTSFMLNHILETHGLQTGMIGTVVVKINQTYTPSELTTPESLELQSILKQMVDEQVTHVNMEVSSAALEMHRVEGISYDIVTLNNLGREHIDHHHSFERYYEAKTSLIKQANEESVAVLNLDCPYSSSLVDETKARTVTYGIDRDDGHLYCTNLDLTSGRATFTVHVRKPILIDQAHESYSFEVTLAVPGLHSVYNALVAIAVAMLCGIPVATIQQSLRTFTGVERRFEMVYEDGFKIIDDHFANVNNINITLQTLEQMAYRRLHLVYAIRGNRGFTVNKENAETIVEWASRLQLEEVIATTSVSHVTKKDWVTAEELRIFQEVMSKAGIKVKLFEELPDATGHALAVVQAEDVILLAGCQGMDHGAKIILDQLKEHPVQG